MHDYPAIKVAFLEELCKSSQGTTSTLPYLVHHFPSQPIHINTNTNSLILIIGGSNYLKARYQTNTHTITEREGGETPPFPTADALFSFIRTHMDNHTEHCIIGFAYPLAPVLHDNTTIDGILIAGAKGNAFQGLVGKPVGLALKRYMQKHQRNITFSILNDSMCALLGASVKTHRSSTMCFIAGTGTNSAFFKSTYVAVNVQSGEFTRMPLSPTGSIIDQRSLSPGTYFFEKEMGGKYLHQHYNLLIQKQSSPIPPIPSTKALDAIAHDEKNPGCHIARRLWHRSASLTATQIAGIVEYKQQDMRCLMVGSLWEAYKYKETVAHMIKELTSYTVELFTKEHSEIHGCVNLLDC